MSKYQEERFRVLEQMTVVPDWDGRGADAISPILWARAWNFYQDSRRVTKEDPYVYPGPYGSVYAVWVPKHKKYYLEFTNDKMNLWLRYVEEAPLVHIHPTWEQAINLLDHFYPVTNH